MDRDSNRLRERDRFARDGAQHGHPSRTILSRAKREAWPGDALSCFAFSDAYSFDMLQSGIHWSWFIATCSKLKGDFRYTPESVFDTFPSSAGFLVTRARSP